MKHLLLFLALAAPLHAVEETRTVDVSFYCLKYAAGLETIHVPQGSGSAAVRLSTANLTDPLPATVVNGQAVLSRGAIDPTSKTPAESVGKFTIPADIREAIVVLIPDKPGSAQPYRSLVLDRGERFRAGTYRVINFSPKKIRGAIGRSYIEAASGKTGDLELKGEPGTVQGVRFEVENDGRWNRLTETRCAVRKDRRWLLCVYQDPATGRVSMRSIPDRTRLLVPATDETITSNDI